MKRFFNRRVLVRILASFITLYVLFVIIENWTGPRALAAAEAKLLKEVETLDFTAILPQPPPEDQNFCAIEPLARLKDSERKPAGPLAALDWTTSHVEGLDTIPLGKAPDLKPLIANLAAKGIGKANASPDEMLAALDAAHPVLKSLANTAPQRPAAQFIPMIGEGRQNITHSELQYTHFTQTQPLSKALLLRGNLAIAAGNAVEAVKSIQASLRLAEAHLQEPVLIGLIVGSAINSSTMSRVWALLYARIASEPELATLQHEIARMDLLTALLQATRGELAVAAHTLAALRSRPELRRGLYGEYNEALDAESDTSFGDDLLNRLLPTGFYEHSEARLLTACLDHLILPMKNQDFQTLGPALTLLEKRIKEDRHLARPHHWLAALNLGNYSPMIRRVAEAETRRRQALAAIAIERIRQTAGAYPTTLPDGPLDLIDGEPMRYRLEGSGYLLWSIGLDNEAHGGKAPGPEDHPQSSEFTGGWVWQMPAEN